MKLVRPVYEVGASTGVDGVSSGAEFLLLHAFKDVARTAIIMGSIWHIHTLALSLLLEDRS